MGTIVDDPLDFYSTRVPKKQQKSTILEELVEDAKVKKYVLITIFYFKLEFWAIVKILFCYKICQEAVCHFANERRAQA